MAHIHEKIDFVNVAYIVHKNKVLMIHHNTLQMWLPVGGHIELDEDTDEALFREIKEETGLSKKDLEFIDNRPGIKSGTTKFLLVPQHMNIHKIKTLPGHRHILLVYFVRSGTNKVKLKKDEHSVIKWFSVQDLKKTRMKEDVRYCGIEALRILGKK